MIVGCLFVALLLQATAAFAVTKNSQHALKLTQRHNYWGDTETIVSMNGIRINNKGRMKYSLVAKSPNWKVVVFRDDDKTFISQSLQSFEKNGLVSDLVVKEYPHFIGELSTMRTGRRGRLKTQIFAEPFAQVEVLPLANITTAPVEAIIYAAYKLPTNGGIPLKYTKILRGSETFAGKNVRGTSREYLNTSRIQQVDVSTKLFEPPLGYKRCNSVQEVLLSKVSREASGDFDELFEIKDRSKGN